MELVAPLKGQHARCALPRRRRNLLHIYLSWWQALQLGHLMCTPEKQQSLSLKCCSLQSLDIWLSPALGKHVSSGLCQHNTILCTAAWPRLKQLCQGRHKVMG